MALPPLSLHLPPSVICSDPLVTDLWKLPVNVRQTLDSLGWGDVADVGCDSQTPPPVCNFTVIILELFLFLIRLQDGVTIESLLSKLF